MLATNAAFHLKKTRIGEHVQQPLGERIKYIFVGRTDPELGERQGIKFYCRLSDGEITERAWVSLIENWWYRRRPAIVLVHLYLRPSLC
jgi:hypothetical protein